MDLFKSAKFTQHVSELMEEWHTPGLAIALVQDETVASQGYGYASLEETPPPTVTGDTVFDIASSSKSMTAAAVALLVTDDEKYPNVKWDTPVSELLPEDFVMAKEEYTKGITVEDILSHRTGLPGHDFSYLSPRAQHPDTLQSVTRNLRNLEISSPMRSKWMYCNMMFTVAAYLVEQLSELSFEAYLRKHFWGPLGMASTNLQSWKAIEAGLPVAQPYKWREESQSYAAVERQLSPEAEGAGLIVTSVNDYVKWAKAMMHQEGPVSEEVFRGLTKPRSFERTEPSDYLDPFASPEVYAAGLEIVYYRGYQIISHDGSDPGLNSRHFFVPHVKFGGVILGNSASADRVIQVVSRELIDEALGIPRTERTDWVAWERKLIARDEREREEERSERRKQLCPDATGESQPQQTPLTAYTGEYWNAGYHGITVQVNTNNRLFIDMSDRTMGFTLELEHLCNQTKYIAHRTDYYEGAYEEVAAEFVFENDEVVKLGIDLDEDLEGKRVWFDKVNGNTLPVRTAESN